LIWQASAPPLWNRYAASLQFFCELAGNRPAAAILGMFQVPGNSRLKRWIFGHHVLSMPPSLIGMSPFVAASAIR
jgi:hypothetical protein